MSADKPKKGFGLLKFGKKTDSVPLKLNHVWNGDQMPYSLKSCFAFIYCYDIDTVHIFRKNGNKVAHEVLSSYLKKNLDVAPTFYVSSVHDVCSAIRAYVKDIPNGLLVKDLEHEWHKVVRLHNESKVKEKLMSIINKLPAANRIMLFHLLFIASAVVDHRQKNEMSAKSISIIFMPTMFEQVVDIRKVRDLYGFYDLLEFMIENAEWMMGKDTYDQIETSLRKIGAHLHIVHEVGVEPSKLTDENRRVQFVSQDSGLNSTSFIDDKESRSLSHICMINNNEYESGLNSDQNISSIEDLLNSLDNSSEISDHHRDISYTYRSSTLVRNTKTVISLDTSFGVLGRSNSRTSTSSVEEYIHDCSADFEQAVNKSLTCVGSKLHSIKECRPYSICGPPSFTTITKSSHCHHNTSQVNLYTPVYDRSFQRLEIMPERQYVSTHGTNNTESVFPGLKIQRKKSILKRASCIIAPLERLNIYGDRTTLTTSTSMMTKCQSQINICSTSPNMSRTCKGQVQSKQKFRIKRKPTLFRSHLSVPINHIDVEAPLLPSQRMIRAESLQPSSHNTMPLPQPLNIYLRQRSSEETFV